MLARCRLLQAAAQNAGRKAKGVKPLLRKVDLLTQAVQGSHWAVPGTHGGGRGGRPSAPTADGRLRRMSRGRKGVLTVELSNCQLSILSTSFDYSSTVEERSCGSTLPVPHCR